jgi:hypothetical protein
MGHIVPGIVMVGTKRGRSMFDRSYDHAGCYHWRKSFALWPVKTIKGKWVWLRKIYKQKFYSTWWDDVPTIEYAELFDVLNGNN